MKNTIFRIRHFINSGSEIKAVMKSSRRKIAAHSRLIYYYKLSSSYLLDIARMNDNDIVLNSVPRENGGEKSTITVLR